MEWVVLITVYWIYGEISVRCTKWVGGHFICEEEVRARVGFGQEDEHYYQVLVGCPGRYEG
jgi:hypothetical protein